MSPTDPEVPEADALEQAEPAVRELEPEDEGAPQRPLMSSGGFEVPEADALDQSREVPLDDEDR